MPKGGAHPPSKPPCLWPRGTHANICGGGGDRGGEALPNIHMIEIGQEQKGTPKSKGKAKANNNKPKRRTPTAQKKASKNKAQSSKEKERKKKKTKIHNPRNMDVGDSWAPGN